MFAAGILRILTAALDIEIHSDDLGNYCKPTNTGQYTHYSSVSPWRYKTAWITNIIHRAIVICDKSKLPAELTRIKYEI